MPDPGPPEAEATTLTETLLERRRPGRVEYASRHAIALMRGPTTADPRAPEKFVAFDEPGSGCDDADNLGPARGILAGLALALPLWALIGAGAWLLLRG